MKRHTSPYHEFFIQPLSGLARVVLLLAIVAEIFAFTGPLWNMSFRSNQYPDALKMSIHINHLAGQKTESRDDLREINSLNHYIGMRPILESDFAEFTWLPFVVGAFGLLILRAVIFGRIRDLLDIVVLYVYFGIYSAWDFYNKLYSYGHVLSPDAPIKVEGFTPPIFGEVKIANFWVSSFPASGSYALLVFGGLLVLALALAVWRGLKWFREARKEELSAAAL